MNSPGRREGKTNEISIDWEKLSRKLEKYEEKQAKLRSLPKI